MLVNLLRPLLFLLLCTCLVQANAMSEKKEIELGMEEHRKVLAQFGVYPDPELAAYVDRVGQRVAAQSDRPNLKYTFTVLDDPMINAMALPGGFIYITRGILSNMNSESELAAVLGHEIAHVTEKHAIRAQTTDRIRDIGTGIAATLLGIPGLYELGSIAGGIVMKGFSREMELEADTVGARYMAKAGYNPDAMLKTIEVLKNNDRLEINQARIEQREPRVYHGILATHPDNDRRYKEAIGAAAEISKEYTEFIKTDEFLLKLNGMAYGKRQIGVVRANNFYHPKLGIKLTFPEGWRIESGRGGVFTVSTIGDAMLGITSARISRGMTPKDYVQQKMGLNVREGRELTIAKMPAYLGIADRAQSPFGPRPVRFAVIFDERRRQAYVLTGAGKHDLRKIASDRDFIATIFSFDRMTREDFQKAVAPALQVVRAEEGTTIESLAAESAITNYAEDKLRVMNGLYPHGQPEPGQLIKIVQ